MRFVVTIVLFLLGLGLIALALRDTAANPANVKTAEREVIQKGVVSYGNGVYYFPVTKENFGNALADFLKVNGCKVEGMAGNGTSGYGADAGYFIVCR